MAKTERFKFKDYTVKGHTFTVRFEKIKDNVLGDYIDVIIYNQMPHPKTWWQRVKMFWNSTIFSNCHHWRGYDYDEPLDAYVEYLCKIETDKIKTANFTDHQWDEI